MIRSIFDKLDKDSDGMIDSDGYKTMMNVLEIPFSGTDISPQYSYDDVLNTIVSHYENRKVRVKRKKIKEKLTDKYDNATAEIVLDNKPKIYVDINKLEYQIEKD